MALSTMSDVAFKLFDSNGDGVLSPTEIVRIMRAASGRCVSMEEATAIVASTSNTNANGTGCIGYNEFAGLLSTIEGGSSLRAVSAATLEVRGVDEEVRVRVVLAKPGSKGTPTSDTLTTTCSTRHQWPGATPLTFVVADTRVSQIVFTLVGEKSHRVVGRTSLRLWRHPENGTRGDLWLTLRDSTPGAQIHVSVVYGSAGGTPVTTTMPAKTVKATTACLTTTATGTEAPQFGPTVDTDGRNHTKYAPSPAEDYVRNFTAFTSCFDGPDDDDGDGVSDLMGVPSWVAYELDKREHELPKYDRPPWTSGDETLERLGVAPDDKSYRGSGEDRGHMCMKTHADRISKQAGLETHTFMNACPQTHVFNAGVWMQLENKCGEWADTYGKVWVIAGPIFEPGHAHNQRKTIGRGTDFHVWVPDGFYKVVVKEEADGSVSVISWMFDHFKDKDGNEWTSNQYDLNNYITAFETVCQKAHLQWKFPCVKNTPQKMW